MIIFQKVKKLFIRYPDTGLNPSIFGARHHFYKSSRAEKNTVVFQLLPDEFYFLLFGVLCSKLKKSKQYRIEMISVRGISASMGFNLWAEILRLPIVVRLALGPWLRAYGTLVDKVGYRCASWSSPLQMWQDWKGANFLWGEFKKSGEKKLNIQGIEVADLLIDTYLRFSPSPTFNINDLFVKRLIWQAIGDVRKAQNYFRLVNPKLYCTSYTTYLEHGIPVRVAMQQGIQVWSFGSLNIFCKKHRDDDWFHTPDCSNYRKNFESYSEQEKALQDARKGLEVRISGGVDLATSYMNQSAYKLSGKIPDNLNGSVVIFLHDFYDSPHVYKNFIFDDFWQWLLTTINILRDAKIPFYLKPHPNQVDLSDLALERIKEQYGDLNWLPSSVNNLQLANAGVVGGITAYGTVAHELAFFGIPSVTCAQHPHHTFDFCYTAESVSGYKKLLLELPINRMDKIVMQRQALAFYWAHNLNQNLPNQRLLKCKINLWKVSSNIGCDKALLDAAIEDISSAIDNADLLFNL